MGSMGKMTISGTGGISGGGVARGGAEKNGHGDFEMG